MKNRRAISTVWWYTIRKYFPVLYSQLWKFSITNNGIWEMSNINSTKKHETFIKLFPCLNITFLPPLLLNLVKKKSKIRLTRFPLFLPCLISCTETSKSVFPFGYHSAKLFRDFYSLLIGTWNNLRFKIVAYLSFAKCAKTQMKRRKRYDKADGEVERRFFMMNNSKATSFASLFDRWIFNTHLGLRYSQIFRLFRFTLLFILPAKFFDAKACWSFSTWSSCEIKI